MNFRTKNAAKYVGGSAAWLRKRRRRGDGPPYIRIDGLILYRQKDLDEWMERHLCVSGNGEPAQVNDREEEEA